MLTLVGITPCEAVNIIPYPQSVEMSDVVFNKAKINKIKYVKAKDMPAEAYELHIKKSGIVIKASDDAGRFYALQSLNQLAEDETMYCGVIKDAPRFSWRGFMLDEARHFFGKEEVKQVLDMMARYKLNRFHWHLSDDQGWRVEIKAFPELTKVGGIGCYFDSNAPARFYTREEIREILAYAAERHIEVIPEIDMPGHASAFNRVMPALKGNDRTVNPGKEETYTTLATIYKELADLFPGRYIHIGGDEVNKNGWDNLPEVKALMEKEGHLVWIKAVNYMKEIYEYKIEDNPKVIGVQSNLWTERVITHPRREYMIYPRILALAEKAWTLDSNIDYSAFLKRVENEYKFLDKKNIHYYDFRNPARHPEPKR